MSVFNQAAFTHGEQSQVFTAVILKVFFLSIWNNCSSNTRGSSLLRGVAVRFIANLARNCKLRTPCSVLKVFIRVKCLREVREVFSHISKLSFCMLVGRPSALKNIAGSTYLLFLLPVWGRFHQESFFFCAGSLSLMNISAKSVQKKGSF